MFLYMKNLLIFSLIFFTLACCGFNDIDDRMNLTIYSGEGDLEKVQEYLPKVSTLNFISLKGETPLNAAAYNGHLEVVKLLLRNGASCTYKDRAGNNAYTVAVQQKQEQVRLYLKSINGCSK